MMEKQRKEKAATCLLFFPHPSKILFFSYSNSSIAYRSRCALNTGSHAAGHLLAYITQLETSNFNSVVLSSHTQKSTTAQKLSIPTGLAKLFGSITNEETQISLQKIQQYISAFPLTPKRTRLLVSLSCLLPPPAPSPRSLALQNSFQNSKLYRLHPPK